MKTRKQDRKIRTVLYLPLSTYRWLQDVAKREQRTISQKGATIITEAKQGNANGTI